MRYFFVLFLLIFSHPCWALTPVQTVNGASASGVNTVAATISGVLAGDTLFIAVDGNSITAAAISSIVDSVGNTVNIIDTQSPAAGSIAAGADIIAATSGSHTITVTFNNNIASACASIQVREYHTADAVSLDQHTATTGTGTVMSSGATANTTQANESVLGWAGREGSTAITAGAGFGNFALKNGATNNCQIAIEDMSVTSIGAQTATFNDSAGGAYAAGVMTFKTQSGIGNLMLLGSGQ